MNNRYAICNAGAYTNQLSTYVDSSGRQTVIPPGWTVSGLVNENTIWGKNRSVVIYKLPEDEAYNLNWNDVNMVDAIMRKYNQYVWLPIKEIYADKLQEFFAKARTDSQTKENADSIPMGYEPMSNEFAKKCEFINKYGGIYISRYEISKEQKTGKPQSVKDAIPWTKISFNNAKAILLESDGIVKTQLTFGIEHEAVLRWFIKSGAKTYKEIAEDSSEFGNYYAPAKSICGLAKTGSNESWRVNNIYDIAGNVSEFTQERIKNYYCVVRGGSFLNNGKYCPAIYRSYCDPDEEFLDTGFRATLYF